MDTTIRARVDDRLKKDVEVILAAQGLNMSQAIRMMLRKTKETGSLPFELPTPNTESLRAMAEARAGRLKSFDSVVCVDGGFKCGRLSEQGNSSGITSASNGGAMPLNWASRCLRLSDCWRLMKSWRPSIKTIAFRAIGQTTGNATSSPDLLLIYRKPDEHVLQLVRMGSHAELFG